MIVHGDAKLGPAGRCALVQAIADGMTQKAAAVAFCVSPATAHRWWHRRQAASAEELRPGAWVLDRSSRPHLSPRLLDADGPGADLPSATADGMGPEAGGRRDRSSTLDRLEGPAPPWDLPPATPTARGCPPL
jgi:Helix-turn-helix domain